jgi:hypothetical protein
MAAILTARCGHAVAGYPECLGGYEIVGYGFVGKVLDNVRNRT